MRSLFEANMDMDQLDMFTWDSEKEEFLDRPDVIDWAFSKIEDNYGSGLMKLYNVKFSNGEEGLLLLDISPLITEENQYWLHLNNYKRDVDGNYKDNGSLFPSNSWLVTKSSCRDTFRKELNTERLNLPSGLMEDLISSAEKIIEMIEER